MNGTPDGPTCRALFRAGEDDAPPYWMAFNEETSDRADRFSSLGMALSDVMPGAASAEIASFCVDYPLFTRRCKSARLRISASTSSHASPNPRFKEGSSQSGTSATGRTPEGTDFSA